jgi:hypothetical protein
VCIDNIATPVVCILSGYLQQKLGPKKVGFLQKYHIFITKYAERKRGKVRMREKEEER